VKLCLLHLRGCFGIRSLRFIVLVLVVVLAVNLIPELAERDWAPIVVEVVLISALMLWYRTLKRRS
jgi:hypothetical protein